MTPEEVELLRELTIVIPTYNRPLELERAIEYWRDTPITVHILDGSQSPSFARGKLPGIPTITYHHFPSTENELLYENYYKRIKFASTLPITKFSAMIGEDDFFAISGLFDCLQILSSERSIRSVTGITLGFENLSVTPSWSLRDLESNESKIFENRSLARRLGALKTSNTPILYYGIFETDCWKNTFNFSYGYTFKTNKIGGERLVNSVAVTLGPTAKVNKVVWLRRNYVERTNFETDGLERGSYDRYLSNDSNRTEVAGYYSALGKAIVIASPSISHKKALRLSKIVLAPNLWSSQSGRKYHLRRKIARFMVASGRIVPKDIRRLINRTLATKVTGSLGFADIPEELKPALAKQTLSDLLINLKDTGIVFDRSEIESVEKLILKPREELRLHANI